MFGIMKSYGTEFKPEWWLEVFEVAFRIFKIIQMPEQQTERAEWLMTTCNHALFSIVDVFSQFYPILHENVLPKLYEQIEWCVDQENEQLAKNGVECMGNVVITNGTKFNTAEWETTISLIFKLFRSSIATQLIEWEPESIPPSNVPYSGIDSYVGNFFNSMQIKCVVQLE